MRKIYNVCNINVMTYINNHIFISTDPQNQSAPSVVELNPRSMRVSWQPPEITNGIIHEYKLYMNNALNQIVSNIYCKKNTYMYNDYSM